MSPACDTSPPSCAVEQTTLPDPPPSSPAPPPSSPAPPSASPDSLSVDSSSVSASKTLPVYAIPPPTETKESTQKNGEPDLSSLPKEPTSSAAGVEGGEAGKGSEAGNADDELVRGDPRMKRALEIRLETPALSPVAALIMGGYTPLEASTHQHRNQLSRRVRIERQRLAKKMDHVEKEGNKEEPVKKNPVGEANLAEGNAAKKSLRGSKVTNSDEKAMTKTATRKIHSKKDRQKFYSVKGAICGADALGIDVCSLPKKRQPPAVAEADNEESNNKKKRVIGLGLMDKDIVRESEKAFPSGSRLSGVRSIGDNFHGDNVGKNISESFTETGYNINIGNNKSNIAGEANSSNVKNGSCFGYSSNNENSSDINRSSDGSCINRVVKELPNGSNHENNSGENKRDNEESIIRNVMKDLLNSRTQQNQEEISLGQTERKLENNSLHLLGGMTISSGVPPVVPTLSFPLRNTVGPEEKRLGEDFNIRRYERDNDLHRFLSSPLEVHGRNTSELNSSANRQTSVNGGYNARIGPVSRYSTASTEASSINEALLGTLSSSRISSGCSEQFSNGAARFERNSTGTGSITGQSFVGRSTSRDNSFRNSFFDSGQKGSISHSVLESMMGSRLNGRVHGRSSSGGDSKIVNVPNGNCFGNVSHGMCYGQPTDGMSAMPTMDMEQARSSLGRTGSIGSVGSYGRNSSYSHMGGSIGGGSPLGTTIAVDNTTRERFSSLDHASNFNSYSAPGNTNLGAPVNSIGMDHLGQTLSLPLSVPSMMQSHTGTATTKEDYINAISELKGNYEHIMKQCAIDATATNEGRGQALSSTGRIPSVSSHHRQMDARSMAARLSSARSGTASGEGPSSLPTGNHHITNSQDDCNPSYYGQSMNGNIADALSHEHKTELQKRIAAMEKNHQRQMMAAENDPRLMTDIMSVSNRLLRQHHQQQQHHHHKIQQNIYNYQQQLQQQHQVRQQQYKLQHLRQANFHNALPTGGGFKTKTGPDADVTHSASLIDGNFDGHKSRFNSLGHIGSSKGIESLNNLSNGYSSGPPTNARDSSGQDSMHSIQNIHNINSTGFISGHHNASPLKKPSAS
eukprot:CAMPEP_0194266960 /NCGR_PEP_ID=MMETSP0169-20130528/1673_1 /TAXON_ID=218684 /ORGANISM="Corethron pennatum, Strain L29A3" /LENGTH=1083 /DNA_ID=CAMNT_0039007741 /DNA_START=135 /DNA_END=3386 /DNA_ORIENTATION=-